MLRYSTSQNSRYSSFTLVEILVVIALMAVLSVVVVAVIDPVGRIQAGQYSQAVAELRDMAHAVELYLIDNSSLPPDTSRGITPVGLETYTNVDWGSGPFPGSQYDYDNWTGDSCIDSGADGTVQVTLRNVPGRNPDGTNNWAWYYVLEGSGTPHCNDVAEQPYGECINCDGFNI